jgi:hypothetical protein
MKVLDLLFGRGDPAKPVKLELRYHMKGGILTGHLGGVTKEVALADLVEELLNEFE